jgi:hypothetical protein
MSRRLLLAVVGFSWRASVGVRGTDGDTAARASLGLAKSF